MKKSQTNQQQIPTGKKTFPNQQLGMSINPDTEAPKWKLQQMYDKLNQSVKNKTSK